MSDLEKYFDSYRRNIIGIDTEIETPCGRKKLVYADWIASGRLYKPIEDRISYDIGPLVGNTHSESSATGYAMTEAYHLAQKIVKHHVNADDNDVQILSKDKSIQMITGNPFTIEELYSNLLLNAVKYTPPHGRIELTVKSRLNYIITEISDSGIGIPKEELLKVFDEFYRATNVPKDIKTGSGLGLSIVKQIVENHNGKTWVSSELGVWTKFTFILSKNPTFLT